MLDQEVVERKGLGHPDTLVDGIVESAEIAYAEYCLAEFGYIPHHNFDKAMLLGGLCRQEFGGSDFSSPVRMIFMGRGSREFGSKKIPLEKIQTDAAVKYLNRIMPHLDTSDKNTYESSSMTSSHSTRQFWFSPRGVEDLPEYADDGPKANDTATMISYWPLTTAEKLSLDLEGYFYVNNEDGLPKPRFDYFGQDIKVMTVRNKNKLTATLAVPQVTTKTENVEVYFEREKQLRKDLQVYADQLMIGSGLDIEVIVNSQTIGKNPRPYLVTGGSCTDFGEEGAVGRGNKTHGIISSFRPNTMEAPHGKNSTYFVGKVLGYQADIIAKAVYESVKTPCQVILQVNIGDYLFDPSQVIVSTKGKVDSSVVEEVVKKCLSMGRNTTTQIINEKHFIPRTNVWRGYL
jgi:S-adenosylmethionine synthetase